ncbi:MAG: glycolate oxidase subunit GlcF [Pseudomonadota bacterium]
MQTNFSLAQLADPGVAEAESILRNCVHCGFCTATCPTYVTLGNELDSPRGRIYLIKDMLENDRPADDQVVKHIDRCLSCLACMTTCPSGVHYMHLVDHARVHIEETYKRPFMNRMMRGVLTMVLPYPARFRAAVSLSKLGKPFAPIFDMIPPLKPVAAMLRLAPSKVSKPQKHTQPGTFSPEKAKLGRVALLSGCAQPALDDGINKSTIDLLNRLGVEVVLPQGEACCGSLVHHMGREHQALDAARNMVDVWTREIENGGLDAIIITTSGCGTTIKDYGYMLRLDKAYAEKAARISALAKDVSEYLTTLNLPQPRALPNMTVAYHAACSLQHGQKIKTAPKDLLKAAGFTVREAPESHLCCGSAGTYNILQPEIAGQLRERKVNNIRSVKPDVIAAGNIGCMTQIGSAIDVPVLHTVKLLDWAYGGPKPKELEGWEAASQEMPLAAE